MKLKPKNEPVIGTEEIKLIIARLALRKPRQKRTSVARHKLRRELQHLPFHQLR